MFERRVLCRHVLDLMADDAKKKQVREIEQQWGVRVLQLGFSNISPSPATLEITQLELLARERLALFDELLASGMSEPGAVALITGAVVATHPPDADPGRRKAMREQATRAQEVSDWLDKSVKERRRAEEQEEEGEEELEEDQES